MFSLSPCFFFIFAPKLQTDKIMRIAVVGATGLVGSKMLQVLDEQKVQIDELIVAASERSVGKEIVFQNKT